LPRSANLWLAVVSALIVIGTLALLGWLLS
jgi:hypothetical protein